MFAKRKPGGYELIMDLHNCDASTFNRKSLKNYFIRICKVIGMKRENLYFWDDFRSPKEDKQASYWTKGTSAVQFILTSSIVIHTLDLLKVVYVNIFSCKPFDKKAAEKFTREWFKAKECKSHFIERT